MKRVQIVGWKVDCGGRKIVYENVLFLRSKVFGTSSYPLRILFEKCCCFLALGNGAKKCVLLRFSKAILGTSQRDLTYPKSLRKKDKYFFAKSLQDKNYSLPL